MSGDSDMGNRFLGTFVLVVVALLVGFMFGASSLNSFNLRSDGFSSSSSLSPGFYYINGTGPAPTGSTVHAMLLIFDENKKPVLRDLDVNEWGEKLRFHYVPKDCFDYADGWTQSPRLNEAFEVYVGKNETRRCVKIE